MDLGKLTPKEPSSPAEAAIRVNESQFNLSHPANSAFDSPGAEPLPSFAPGTSKYRRPILGGGFDCNQPELAIAMKQEK